MTKPSEQRPPLTPAATRRQLLMGLPAVCLAPAALASKTRPQANRIKLPTDGAIAVSIHVKGNFTSLYNKQTRQLDLPTTICSFALDETVAEESLDAHEIAFMPDIPEAGWGAFAPSDATVTYLFDITDDKGRLDKMIIAELGTGKVVGTLKADATGTVLKGEIVLPADDLNYFLRGVNKAEQPVFRMVTNKGKADTYLFYAFNGSFQPNRLMYAACTNRADKGSGTAGSPRSLGGISSSSSPGATEGYTNVSIMEVYASEENDRSGPWPLNPQVEAQSIVKRQVLVNDVTGALVNNPLKQSNNTDLPKLLDILTTLTKPDATNVLNDIAMPPYSENCGLWRMQLTGTAFTVLAFPYNRAKNRKDLIDQALSFFNKTVTMAGHLLAEILSDGVKTSLNGTDTGKLIAGEVFSLGNVYILEAQAIGTALESLPIFDTVSLKVTPDPADPAHILSFEGTVEFSGPNATPPPPVFAGRTTFQVIFNDDGTAKINLPKGWKWKFTGNAKAPGYTAGTAQFNSPTKDAIEVISKRP